MSASVTFRVLGPLEVRREGTLLQLGAAKPRALLGLLLIRRSQVARDVIIDALWGDHPPEGARNTLQVYVSRLRRMLGNDAIETTPVGYALHVESGAVDAEEFERRFREGRDLLCGGDASRALATLSAALALWRGPAFADLRYEPFAQAEAGRLDELRLACLEERIDAELALGRHAEVIGELEALVIEHPLRERPRGQLILALYRSGRQSEALAQYQAARRMLADELGLEPSPELRDLERMILAHDPGLAAPLSTVTPRSTLPAQPTPFVGRDEELAELVKLIRSGGRRLVTLVGPGGSGKTRLAVEAASLLTRDFEDGVWWVPLQGLRDPQLVAATIGGSLESAGDLADHVGDRRMLVLLDNFEQLLDAGPDIAALLASCPNLTLLVTSRERLHVAAEREYEVRPMTEPDAVELFAERAATTGPAEVIAEICLRLDYLPLAVELAAAQTRTMTPDELLGRLGEGLALLSGGPRDAPSRQQTLRATIEWSHDLLTPEEQRLFAILSVFAGDCDARAVATVGGEPGALQALVDKSLLRVQAGPGPDQYSMLQTIREFATEQLEETGTRPSVRQRHAEYFLDCAERTWRRRHEGVADDDDDGHELAEHLPDLREALAYALEADDRELMLKLAASGGIAWSLSGAIVEGRAWLERPLRATEGTQTAERSRLLVTTGGLEQALGDVAAAAALYEEARALSVRIGDPRGELQALIGQLELNATRDDPDVSRALVADARELAEEHGAPYEQARVLFAEADLENTFGDHERADALLEEGLELVRGLGPSSRTLAWLLVNLGWFALQRGELKRARTAFEEYLAATPSKYSPGRATAHSNLGLVALYERDRDRAAEHFRDALAVGRDAHLTAQIAESLRGVAAVAAIDDDATRAARLRGAADALTDAMSVPLSDPEIFIVETYLEPARAALSEDVYANAWSKGRATRLDEAVAYALGEMD